MKFLEEIKLIQGGMGVYVSNWRLAQAVSKERPGISAGLYPVPGLMSFTQEYYNLVTREGISGAL